jgi:hypothetical protein
MKLNNEKKGMPTSTKDIADKRKCDVRGDERQKASIVNTAVLTYGELERDDAAPNPKVCQEDDNGCGGFYPTVVINRPCTKYLTAM